MDDGIMARPSTPSVLQSCVRDWLIMFCISLMNEHLAVPSQPGRPFQSLFAKKHTEAITFARKWQYLSLCAQRLECVLAYPSIKSRNSCILYHWRWKIRHALRSERRQKLASFIQSFHQEYHGGPRRIWQAWLSLLCRHVISAMNFVRQGLVSHHIALIFLKVTRCVRTWDRWWRCNKSFMAICLRV